PRAPSPLRRLRRHVRDVRPKARRSAPPAPRHADWRADRREASRAARARAQRFSVVPQIEAVAGFDLDRRHAFADQRVETRQALADEFVLARRAEGLDRGDDAAAGARDLFIARAAQLHLEFAGAI